MSSLGLTAPLAIWTPGPWELVLILAILLVIYGGRKIPEIARGLGEGIRGFKDAMRGDKPAEKAPDEKK